MIFWSDSVAAIEFVSAFINMITNLLCVNMLIDEGIVYSYLRSQNPIDFFPNHIYYDT
jgi:hypothetical protein